MKRRPGAMRGVRGFTLVEILVVMTLLSVVMLALGSALRTVAQTEERIDQRLARSDEMRVAESFLRATLGRVSGRKIIPQPPAKAGPLFAGAAQSVTWVGVMPARYGAGGRYFFRLAVEPVDQQLALVIRFTPWVDAPTFPDWSAAQSRVLVHSITQAVMSYRDSEMETAWIRTWSEPDRLPDRFQLELVAASGPWPPLVVPIRLLPSSDARSGGASFGPE